MQTNIPSNLQAFIEQVRPAPDKYNTKYYIEAITFNISNKCNNGIRTHNHLVRKRTLNHSAKLASLAKWLSVRLQTKWLWVRIPLQSLKLQIWRLFRARSSLTFRQL